LFVRFRWFRARERFKFRWFRRQVQVGVLKCEGLSNCNHHLDRLFWRCRLFRQGKGGDQDPGAHELGAGLCRPLARSKIPRAAMHREFVICKLDSRWAT